MKYAAKTLRPVTESGWYATEDGYAAYFQHSFGHREWESTDPKYICTQLRPRSSVLGVLVDVLR